MNIYVFKYLNKILFVEVPKKQAIYREILRTLSILLSRCASTRSFSQFFSTTIKLHEKRYIISMDKWQFFICENKFPRVTYVTDTYIYVKMGTILLLQTPLQSTDEHVSSMMHRIIDSCKFSCEPTTGSTGANHPYRRDYISRTISI